MVDLLGMFRRRRGKRNSPGFARARADITALDESMGEMLTSPVRDVPPVVRVQLAEILPAQILLVEVLICRARREVRGQVVLQRQRQERLQVERGPFQRLQQPTMR